MFRPALRRRAVFAAGVAAASAATCAAVFIPSGTVGASPTPTGYTGTTVLTLGGPTITTLVAGSCGGFTIAVNNGASNTGDPKKLKIILPISQVTVDPGTGGFDILHQGGFELFNNCYDIGVSAVRINNYGQADQSTELNINAVTHADNQYGRNTVGSLDLTNANVTISGRKTRITKADLLADDDGAQILNELVSGTNTGPFYAGEKIGSAKITLVSPTAGSSSSPTSPPSSSSSAPSSSGSSTDSAANPAPASSSDTDTDAAPAPAPSTS